MGVTRGLKVTVIFRSPGTGGVKVHESGYESY